jgi:hypothetical protein
MSARRWWRVVPLWVWSILVSVLLLIGLPLLGLNASLRHLGSRWDKGAGRWRSLGAPPERPMEIVDADLDRVYVRGQDGALFECDRTGPTRDDACWKEVEQPRERESWVEHGDAYQGKRPAPPGPVKEALDVSWQFAERASYARYVLLEDASVWVWVYHADANASLLLLFGGPVCGLALALAIVLAIWLVVGVRALLRRRRARG